MTNLENFNIKVDDDVSDSDQDTDYQHQYSSSGLSSIVEEVPGVRSRWTGVAHGHLRRRVSNLSGGTIESDLGTESDFIGSVEDRPLP